MDEITEKLLNYNAINTLAELNAYFCNSNIMSKSEFMKIQKKVWQETKETFGVKL